MRFATIVIATLVVGETAWADAESTRLFEEGRSLSQQGQYQEACDRFARSYELERATGTQVNMGDCEEHLGHIARAWQLFDDAAHQSDREGNSVRAQYARRRADTLVPRLGALVVTIEQPAETMQVTIGGRAYLPGPEIRAYVDPGDVEIRVQLPGKQFKQTLRVGAGESATLAVPAFTEPAPSGVGASATPTRQRGWLIAAGISTGVGVIGLASSALLTIAASRGYGDTFVDGECMYTPRGPECTERGLQRVADARSVANIATGFAIGGTLALAGGIALYMLAPRTRLELAPSVTSDGASVTVGGRF